MLRGDASPHYYVGRLWPVVPQSETEVQDLEVGPDVVAATFVGNDTLAIATNTDRNGASAVKGLPLRLAGNADAPGSVVTPTLFEVPGRVASLVADVAGDHFLAVTEDGALYRWSFGDTGPTKLADGVTAAAWLPDVPDSGSSVVFGSDAHVPSDFPAGVPLPNAGSLKSVVSEKNPPNASYTITYGLDGSDARTVADEYRDRLALAGFTIQAYSSGGDGAMTQFEAIGKKWDVAAVSGKASPRDRDTLSVTVRTHGQPAADAGLIPTTTTIGP